MYRRYCFRKFVFYPGVNEEQFGCGKFTILIIWKTHRTGADDVLWIFDYLTVISHKFLSRFECGLILLCYNWYNSFAIISFFCNASLLILYAFIRPHLLAHKKSIWTTSVVPSCIINAEIFSNACRIHHNLRAQQFNAHLQLIWPYRSIR